MEVEQLEIRDYLERIAPLTDLGDDLLDELTLSLEIQYVRRGNNLLSIGEKNERLYLVRSGAIEVTTADNELYGRFSEGEWVGYRSLMSDGGRVSLNVAAIEDTLLYTLPAAVFNKLLTTDERVRRYFSERKPERLRSAMQEIRDPNDYSLLSLHLQDLVRPALSVTMQTSIRETAQHMTDVDSKTALVTDKDCLCGIVTDQDFRKRVIAASADVNAAVSTIMTPKPLMLEPNAAASEALLLMARRNIRHIPVVDRNSKTIHGVVSATDLLRTQSHNAVYLVGDIHSAKDIETLSRLSQHLPKALVRMVKSSLPAYDIGHAISSIGQAITRRLLTLAEEKFGAPPVPYAFIVAGSMARREQTAHSDQDNAMLISDDFDPAKHDAYFLNVAKYVSDGLDACGYIYCPGDVMATNPRWRQPLRVWQEYFRDWIESPQPKALMYASIFFDLRCVHGEEALLSELRRDTLQRTQKQTLFQAYMAGNALSHQPPLGFFRGFVLEKNGDNDKALNMKKRGVVPVIDLARVYALSAGLPELNTCERLDAAGKAGALSKESMDDLHDAFEFISTTRLQHQALQIEQGFAPDNYVPPEQLSTLEQRHLKDAFSVVSTVQEAMASHYQADRFR